MQRGQFDFIFIDEAAQAIEPEAVAPVASLLGPHGQLVLAGDVKQLGPVIHSPASKRFGLQTSLMERLMQREIYRKDKHKFPDSLGYDRSALTARVACTLARARLQLCQPWSWDGNCARQQQCSMPTFSLRQ